MRMGVDIKIKCEGCGCIIFMKRFDFDKRIVKVIDDKGMSVGCMTMDKQIANILGVAEPTIKMHISALLRAFGVQNRVQILLKAKEKGFI